MHPILSYLAERHLSRGEFVERLRVAGTTTSVAYLNQIVIGHRYPSRDLALVMERVTEGAITLDALMKWQKPPRDDAPAGPESTPPGSEP